jgi:hypothetical protein
MLLVLLLLLALSERPLNIDPRPAVCSMVLLLLLPVVSVVASEPNGCIRETLEGC